MPHFDPAEVTEKAQHHAYNDSNQHSSLYMFSVIVMVCVIGAVIWQFVINGSSGQNASRKNKDSEQREISLSRFNKNA